MQDFWMFTKQVEDGGGSPPYAMYYNRETGTWVKDWREASLYTEDEIKPFFGGRSDITIRRFKIEEVDL